MKSSQKISFICFFCINLLISTVFADEIKTDLAMRFQDKNNDLLADRPIDSSKLIDPYTLVFGTVPSHSFMFKKGAKEALKKHLQKVIGKQVEFFPYQTNAAELEAMRSGMLHIAGMNTGSVPSAVNCAGFHLFAMTAREDGDYGYTMQLITYPGSGINNVSDLKGKTLLFTSDSSNSGHKAPVAILKEKFKLIEGVDYNSRFSGNHGKSVLQVATREFKVAAVASGFTNAMELDERIPKSSFKMIYESETFPSTGYGYSHKLKPALAKKIELAFKTFRWRDTPQSSPKAFNKFNQTQFISANYKKMWGIIRTIDKANGISYECK